MKVMFKQSFKNMGYCWLMSDIVKNSFSLFEDKGRNHKMNTWQMFCSSFLAWEHTVQRRLVSKKISKCDEGIRSGLWDLVRLDGRWFGKDSFRLTEEAISFNAMHILNSFIIRSLFSNLSYTIKGDKSNIE